MADIYALANRFRRELLRMERTAASEMVRAYGGIWQRLRRQIEDLAKESNQTWAIERARQLIAQTEAEIGRYMAAADRQILMEQRDAIAAARTHAEQMVMEQIDAEARIMFAWNRLPVAPVERMVGYARPDAPLGRLLSSIGEDASRKAGDALIQGIALGLGPRETARQMREALGTGLSRTLTIARTETLRAYREATRESYIANSDIVAGWLWVASKSGRTCPACLAMDGTWHRTREHFGTHPNCRCALAPVLKGVERPTWETGKDWLARQDEETQRRVLGAGYDTYKQGVDLGEWVARRESKVWGTTRYAKRPQRETPQ